MSVNPAPIAVQVAALAPAADGITVYELRAAAGGELPAFTAGAHVDLQLANGLVRSYSLINPQGERHRYVIAVNKDRASRGGSTFIHETLKPGSTLSITPPRNNFALVEDAPHVVFIAGGIGVTPILCMIRRLEALGRSWELHYTARTRALAAFREELGAMGARVRFNYDEEPGGKLLDVAAIVAASPAGAHLYCCGPTGLLKTFEAAASARPPGTAHVEYFTAKDEAATAGGFVVELARAKRSFTVAAGKTILGTLLDAGLDVAHSCTEGICGTCETKVLDGVPDHRDSVLSATEQAAGKTMMICVSGAKSPKLVLDL